MASCTDTLRVEKICDSVAKDLGYSMLKDIQKNVISSFVLGNDVFAVLPTGYGKSLCYACLPGVFRMSITSIVIVIMPLTSIIINDMASIMMQLITFAYVSTDNCISF